MRRRLAVLGTTTSVVLIAAVVAAAPAEARRNIGGSVPEGSVCVTPGKAQVSNPNSGALCICLVLPDKSVVRNVGKGQDTTCPPGISR